MSEIKKPKTYWAEVPKGLMIGLVIGAGLYFGVNWLVGL